MKKAKAIIVILICGLFVFSISAQTDKGKFLIAGSSSLDFGANSDKHKSDDGDGTDGKSIIFSMSPQVGFFIMDGLATGIMFNLLYDSYKQNGAEDRYNSTTFAAGPFVRYYVDLSKIKPFAEGAVVFGFNTDKYGSNKDKQNTFGFQLKGGVAFFLSDNVSLDCGLGYMMYSTKETSDNPTDLRDITSGFIMDFGFSIIL